MSEGQGGTRPTEPLPLRTCSRRAAPAGSPPGCRLSAAARLLACVLSLGLGSGGLGVCDWDRQTRLPRAMRRVRASWGPRCCARGGVLAPAEAAFVSCVASELWWCEGGRAPVSDAGGAKIAVQLARPLLGSSWHTGFVHGWRCGESAPVRAAHRPASSAAVQLVYVPCVPQLAMRHHHARPANATTGSSSTGVLRCAAGRPPLHAAPLGRPGVVPSCQLRHRPHARPWVCGSRSSVPAPLFTARALGGGRAAEEAGAGGDGGPGGSGPPDPGRAGLPGFQEGVNWWCYSCLALIFITDLTPFGGWAWVGGWACGGGGGGVMDCAVGHHACCIV